MKTTKVQLLGTGTCAYDPNRMCSSVYVKLEGGHFVFDFGRGVSHRLLFDLHIDMHALHTIWISHFHPDHVSDLLPFFHALSWSKSGWQAHSYATDTIRIIGPKGLYDFWSKLMAIYPTPDIVRLELLSRLQIIELDQNPFHLFNTAFEWAQLPHANNTGIKFEIANKKIALAGDCPFAQEEVNFIQNTDLAVIDAGHKSDAEIIQTAVLSQTKQLVLTHIDRNLDANALNKAARSQGYVGEIIIGEDLMTLI